MVGIAETWLHAEMGLVVFGVVCAYRLEKEGDGVALFMRD